MDFWKLGGHGALHQPFNQQGAIDFGLQQLGAPKCLFHLFRTHQKQAPYAQRRQLRQQPLHHARTRWCQHKVTPGGQWGLIVNAAYDNFRWRDRLDNGHANLTAHDASLERLSDRSMQNGSDVFSPYTAQDGTVLRANLVRLE